MQSIQEELGYSQNDHKVTFDSQHSHTATHFADNPELRRIVEGALPRLVLEGNWLMSHTDLGRTIGLTDEVATDASDEIVYAKRLNRSAYTSFAKSRTSQPSSLLATAFPRQSDDSYELVSAWIGTVSSPPFPGEPAETPESRPNWTTHALVWGSQAIHRVPKRRSAPGDTRADLREARNLPATKHKRMTSVFQGSFVCYTWRMRDLISVEPKAAAFAGMSGACIVGLLTKDWVVVR